MRQEIEVGIQTWKHRHHHGGECPVVGRWSAYSAWLASSRHPLGFTPRLLESENSFSGSQHPLGKRVIFPGRMGTWLPTSSILPHISLQAAGCQNPLPAAGQAAHAGSTRFWLFLSSTLLRQVLSKVKECSKLSGKFLPFSHLTTSFVIQTTLL